MGIISNTSRWFRKFSLDLINLILYSNLWIALGAFSMCLQTQFLITGTFKLNSFAYFVFFASLFLYAIHRIVGLNKVKPFKDQGRYQVISQYKNHIIFYAFISSLFGVYFFFQLSYLLQIALVTPSIISLAYVLPVLGQKRRLRDFHLIKIFLIALTWAFIVVIVQGMAIHFGSNIPLYFLFLEKALFIFAITLPFDIRDINIDQFNKVKTIPTLLGYQKTRYLAAGCIILAVLIDYFLFSTNIISTNTFFSLLLSYIIAYGLIHFAKADRHDYYFTGLLDGTMLLQSVLVIWLSSI